MTPSLREGYIYAKNFHFRINFSELIVISREHKIFIAILTETHGDFRLAKAHGITT